MTLQHLTRLGGVHIYETDVDPNGVNSAPLGSLALNSVSADVYQNTDGATAWSSISGGGSADHGELTGLGDNDHTQYVNAISDTASINLTLTGQSISGIVLPAGVDHGGLTGLGDNDHTQYLNAVSDTASIDLTIAGQSVSGVVLPAGVDHDATANFIADEHIAHSSVSIAAGIGLTGGGTINTSRTLSLDFSVLPADSLPGLADTIIVDKGTVTGSEDGTQQNPYHSIDTAYNAAVALTPADDNRITIIVYPGIYDEQLIMDSPYIDIIGVDRDSCIIRSSSDPVVTLNLCHNSTLQNMSIWSNGNINTVETTGNVVNTVYFINCRFRDAFNGIFAVNILHSGTYKFIDCIFQPWMATNSILIVNNASAIIEVVNCKGDGYITLSNSSSVTFMNSDLYSTVSGSGIINVGTNAQTVNVIGNRFVTTAGDGVRNTVAGSTISMVGNHIVHAGANSRAFLATANCTLYVAGNIFNSTNADYSMSGTVSVTGVYAHGNSMTKGLHSSIQTIDKIKHVGGGGTAYKTLADAIASIVEADAVVLLHVDVALTGAITPTQYRMMIDGQTQFAITRSAGNPIFTIGNSNIVTLRNVNLVGSIDVTGTAAELHLENCTMTGLIDIQSTTNTSTIVTLSHTSIIGDATDLYAILIADVDPGIRIFDSYLKGASGNEAIHDNGANNNLKIAHSTVMHGDLGASLPLIAVGNPNFASHHNTYNADPSGGNYTNLITTPSDVFDADGDFNWVT